MAEVLEAPLAAPHRADDVRRDPRDEAVGPEAAQRAGVRVRRGDEPEAHRGAEGPKYFPDRTAVLGALAERHRRKMRELNERVFTPEVVRLPLPALLDRLVDPFLEMHLECPAYAHLLLGGDASADIAAVTCALEDEIVDRLTWVVQGVAPALAPSRARLVASQCKSSVKALMSSVAALDDPAARTAVVAETKAMLLAYLTSVART